MAVELEICGYGPGAPIDDDYTDADEEDLFFWNRSNLDSVELVVGDAAPPPGSEWASDEDGLPVVIPVPRASVTVQLSLDGLSSFDRAEASIVVEGRWSLADESFNDTFSLGGALFDTFTLCGDEPECDFSFQIEGLSESTAEAEKLEIVFDYFDGDNQNDLGFPQDVPLHFTRFELQASDVFLLGDLNGDGSRDGFDIDPFVFLLTNGLAGYEEQFPAHPDPLLVADITRDGAIDGFDVNPFVEFLAGAGVQPAHLSAVPLPEPSTWVLIGVICTCVAWFHSRAVGRARRGIRLP